MAHGVLIAFDSVALDGAPAWTSLDATPGVGVTSWLVTRGRPSERDKVETGEATVEGIDHVGALDPTNPTSPFYNVGAGKTKIDPTKQARIELQHAVTGVYHPIFTGYVASIRYVIAPTGDYATFTLSLVDALDILADAEVIPGKAGVGAATVPPASVGNVVYLGQQVNDRIKAALADAALSAGALEWPAAYMTIFSGNVACATKSYSPRTTILTVVDDAVDAELPGIATRYVDRFGVFTFHGRYARFNPGDPSYGITRWKVGDAAAFNGDPTYVAISNDFSFTRSKDNLLNAVLSTPQGIARADVAGQFVSDAASIAEYGVRSTAFEELCVARGDESSPGPFLSANAETKQYGQSWVDNYKVPQNRPDKLVFTSQDPAGPHGSLTWDLMCGVELTDIFQLKTTHPGGGGFNDVDHFVERLSYQCVPGLPQVTLTVEVSPRAYFASNSFAT